MDIINTKNAPAAVGPYSQALKAGDFIFISGQIPFDPKTNKVIPGGIGEQTRQCLDNLAAIINASDCSLNDVIKCNIFIKNMDDFATINEIYGTYFKYHKPARALVEVARLPKDVLIEIEAIVYFKSDAG